MDLINQLTSGSVEYRDNGEVIRHPPTAVMLKAARILVELDKEHTANLNMLLRSQQYCSELLTENENLKKEIYDYRNPKPADPKSVCESKPEVSDVGSNGTGPSESDSDGEGSGTN